MIRRIMMVEGRNTFILCNKLGTVFFRSKQMCMERDEEEHLN